MKILLISNCAFNVNQGSGYAISNYYLLGLKARGHEIDAFQPNDYESFKFLRPYANSYRQALGMLLLACRKLVFNKYDAVVFYGAESFLAIWFLKTVLKIKPLIIHHSNGIENHSIDVLTLKYGHATFDNKPPKWYQFNRYNLFLNSFKHCDVLITNGTYDKEYAISKKLLPAERIFTINLGIDKSYLDLGFRPVKEKIIVYCGTWISRKGIDIIEHDMNLFLKKNPDYLFFVIGCGDSLKKEEVFDPGIISQIEVFPFIKQKEDLRALYLKSSMIIFPSYYDSFGLVLAEAMACSCAPVCSSTGFAYGLEHGNNCFKLDPNEKGKLAEALHFLENDPDERKKISWGAYSTVQRLNWDAQVKSLESLIKNKDQHIN